MLHSPTDNKLNKTLGSMIRKDIVGLATGSDLGSFFTKGDAMRKYQTERQLRDYGERASVRTLVGWCYILVLAMVLVALV